MEVDDLEGLPFLATEPAEAFACYFVIAQVELLKVGPVDLGNGDGALIAHVAEAKVELLQVLPVALHEMGQPIVVEQVAAWVRGGVLKWRD